MEISNDGKQEHVLQVIQEGDRENEGLAATFQVPVGGKEGETSIMTANAVHKAGEERKSFPITINPDGTFSFTTPTSDEKIIGILEALPDYLDKLKAEFHIPVDWTHSEDAAVDVLQKTLSLVPERQRLKELLPEDILNELPEEDRQALLEKILPGFFEHLHDFTDDNQVHRVIQPDYTSTDRMSINYLSDMNFRHSDTNTWVLSQDREDMNHIIVRRYPNQRDAVIKETEIDRYYEFHYYVEDKGVGSKTYLLKGALRCQAKYQDSFANDPKIGNCQSLRDVKPDMERNLERTGEIKAPKNGLNFFVNYKSNIGDTTPYTKDHWVIVAGDQAQISKVMLDQIQIGVYTQVRNKNRN